LSLLVVLCFAVYCVCADRVAVTPSGLRPASCVFGPINPMHTVFDHGSHSEIKDENSRTVKLIGPCVRSIDKDAPIPPDGWNAYTWAQISPTVTQYNGTWDVPVNPKDQGVQTLFLFTGLQDNFDGLVSSVTNIIQPVLQFGASEAGGGDYWAMASWYVDSNSNAYFSDLTQTSVGHGIQGNMVRNPISRVWEIQTIDTNSGAITTLNIATNTTEPYTFVTLEVYTVSNCNEYPTGTVPFTNLEIVPTSSPSWSPVTANGCGEKVTINSPTSVTISF